MAVDVPQPILDALTDVQMPRLPPERPAPRSVEVGGWTLPLHRHGCVVVGSGAADSVPQSSSEGAASTL